MTDDLARPITGALGRFTRDLNAEARAGRLEPVRCRDEEVARLIDILLRHGKNNCALVGPAGVGKTAIAEGLAQRLATGDVPLKLRHARILALDHVTLMAGTAYRGQYEDRIRALVAETSANPDVILFVDELHNLIGQGTALGVAMDAANMLKPALVRGDFRVIGATTNDEYERWVCGDPALERRFQRLMVRELTSAETLEILRSRVERLERHHHVLIDDEALRAAVQLTDEHVKDRRRPDRAIDALDEACAHLHATTAYSPRAESMILALRPQRNGARPSGRDAGSEGERSTDDIPLGADEHEDAIDRFARDPLGALGRFGAGLEAILSGGPESGPPARTGSAAIVPERVDMASVAPSPPPPDLRDVLRDDGVIVRGVDVARVVAVATGQTVRWSE
jgi:ATP-dependent Clp protease ATP-binding subunit ClpA